MPAMLAAAAGLAPAGIAPGNMARGGTARLVLPGAMAGSAGAAAMPWVPTGAASCSPGVAIPGICAISMPGGTPNMPAGAAMGTSPKWEPANAAPAAPPIAVGVSEAGGPLWPAPPPLSTPWLPAGRRGRLAAEPKPWWRLAVSRSSCKWLLEASASASASPSDSSNAALEGPSPAGASAAAAAGLRRGRCRAHCRAFRPFPASRPSPARRRVCLLRT